MLKTNPELYRVAGAKNNHLWLEVIEGPDQGVRVSVPIHNSAYDQQIQEKVLELEIGSVHKFTLVSDRSLPPNWRIKEIHAEREEKNTTENRETNTNSN